MRILIACEYSATLKDSFLQLDHDAWSCDLLPSENPYNHIQADVLTVIGLGWDMMIAHPPCQYLSYAGMNAWSNPGRAELREQAMSLFMALVNAPIPRICIENPRGYPCQVYRKPDQVIHPYMFGDNAMKRTCLWFKHLPPLWYAQPGELFTTTGVKKPSPHSIDASGKKRHFTDGATRDPLERARTFPGIAAAMASQWGEQL